MKRPEMEMSAEMPIESKEVEKKRKDELDWKQNRDPREGKEKKGEGKKPTTVTEVKISPRSFFLLPPTTIIHRLSFLAFPVLLAPHLPSLHSLLMSFTNRHLFS